MGKRLGDARSVFEMVRHFHAVAGVPIANVPLALSPARLSARVSG